MATRLPLHMKRLTLSPEAPYTLTSKKLGFSEVEPRGL
jgi:hypothetical protein